MRVLIQRVGRAAVHVGDETVASIGPGLLVLVGVERSDDGSAARAIALRTANFRIFPEGDDPGGRMNRSILNSGGAALVVSQFTLAASTRRGRRPSFDAAAEPGEARRLFDEYTAALAATGVPVSTGRFGAMMQVELVNDGPVTFLLEGRDPATGDPEPDAAVPKDPPR